MSTTSAIDAWGTGEFEIKASLATQSAGLADVLNPGPVRMFNRFTDEHWWLIVPTAGLLNSLAIPQEWTVVANGHGAALRPARPKLLAPADLFPPGRRGPFMQQ